MEQRYVESGACVGPEGGPALCAMWPPGCAYGTLHAESYEFHSSSRIKQDGMDSPGYECLDEEVKRLNARIGRCQSAGGSANEGKKGHANDKYLCTSVAEGCRDDDSFDPIHGQCYLSETRNHNSPHQASLYPGCSRSTQTSQDAAFSCEWDVIDCLKDGGSVIHARDTECTCEKVETGACVDTVAMGGGAGGSGHSTSIYHCAVDASACDPTSTWIPRADLRREHQIDCRLCTPRNIVKPNYPAIADNVASGLSSTVVMVIIVVGAVLGTVVLLGGVFMWRRQRSSPKPNKRETDNSLELQSNQSNTDSSQVI